MSDRDERPIEPGQLWYYRKSGQILDIVQVRESRVGYGLVMNGAAAAGSCPIDKFRELAAFAGYRERLGGLRELQAALPWDEDTYSSDFRADPRSHKRFEHALLHVVKAVGRLAAAAEEVDHSFEPGHGGVPVAKMLADVVICAMRMASTLPGRPVDLQDAVEARLREKNPGWGGVE